MHDGDFIPVCSGSLGCWEWQPQTPLRTRGVLKATGTPLLGCHLCRQTSSPCLLLFSNNFISDACGVCGTHSHPALARSLPTTEAATDFTPLFSLFSLGVVLHVKPWFLKKVVGCLESGIFRYQLS